MHKCSICKKDVWEFESTLYSTEEWMCDDVVKCNARRPA